MIKLEIKISIVTNKGERKIRDKNIIGELKDMETPSKSFGNPLPEIINPQKKANILLIDPINSPNAKGSLNPPLTGI